MSPSRREFLRTAATATARAAAGQAIAPVHGLASRLGDTGPGREPPAMDPPFATCSSPRSTTRSAGWQSEFTIDPFTIPIEQKADLVLRTNAAALKAPNVRFVSGSMLFVKEEKSYANSDGTFTQQTIVRSWMPFTATTVSSDRTDFQSRGEVTAPMGRGYEYLLEKKPEEHARLWGEQASEKLRAKSASVGRYDLVLHPSHLFLTIHESVAHSTELDRALGYEANYAGTSFVAPPRDVLGKLKLFYEIKGGKVVGMLRTSRTRCALQTSGPRWNARWSKELRARRNIQRRQRTADAVQRGESRMPVEPLQKRERGGHEANGTIDPSPPAATTLAHRPTVRQVVRLSAPRPSSAFP